MIFKYKTCSSISDIKSVISLENNSFDIFIESVLPETTKIERCILGIDEAGRGPVLGPMVYGTSFCCADNQEILKALGCADSKVLTEQARDDIFDGITKQNNLLGWAVHIISPNTISNCNFRRQKCSLNEVSHNAAIGLIQRVLDRGVNLSEVYVDTVGPAEKYEAKLSAIFPQLKIKVSKKADSLFPIVSAASICAKVTRDAALKNWKFVEKPGEIIDSNWGSGYPADPITKEYLTKNIDPVFGFPNIVRFCWSTAETILKDHAVQVDWSDDEEEDNKSTVPITSFFTQNGKQVKQKTAFFDDRGLVVTTKI
ncbi:ribonuclease H2 subunit A [Daktulosphaira vitifoliae]|uniref:ribonuclease H2 subunit A n=1 Tax=Daktulosphaira vitifoliae TaxID=58002 RepID=UPI0021AB0521|nr:ribonuclease H2 subunit A [Daktulosphaira vitifoliae]